MKDFLSRLKNFVLIIKNMWVSQTVLLCLIILLAVVTANGKKDKKKIRKPQSRHRYL